MSNYFDSTAKENKPIIDYFEHKTWLILDTSGSSRSSIKKSITNLGSKIANMHDADNVIDAQKLIETKKPHFIVANKNINGGSTLSLHELHLKTNPNRINCGFYIITEENSLSEVAVALEHDMDGIISIPFTGAAIINCILNGQKHKVAPTPYVKKVNEALEKFLRGDFDSALKLFEAAFPLHKHPYEAHFYIGQIHVEKGELELAEAAFEQGVANNPKYFKCLIRVIELYYNHKKFKKAYDTCLLMAQNYPVSPNRLPQLIRLSIINQKYEDMNNYLTIFNSLHGGPSEIQIYLSAGLVILGKYFINSNENDKALEALKSSFKFSTGKYEVLKNITDSFIVLQKTEVLLDMFVKTDMSVWPETAEGFYFYMIHLTSDNDQEVLMHGESLLKKRVKNILIYRGLIERSIKMKRKIGLIESLVIEATNNFPDNREEFEDLFAQAGASGG